MQCGSAAGTGNAAGTRIRRAARFDEKLDSLFIVPPTLAQEPEHRAMMHAEGGTARAPSGEKMIDALGAANRSYTTAQMNVPTT